MKVKEEVVGVEVLREFWMLRRRMSRLSMWWAAKRLYGLSRRLKRLIHMVKRAVYPSSQAGQ